MNRKVINKKDIWIVLVLVLVAVLTRFAYQAFYDDDKPPKAVIMLNHKIVKEILLDHDETFSLPERPHVVFEINHNRIRFQHSDCPDLICVRSGYLDTPGQMAACLPNGLILKVISTSRSAVEEPDMVVGMKSDG